MSWGAHDSMPDRSCGGREAEGNARRTHACSASSGGSSSGDPSSHPPSARASRYRRSVFGLIWRSRATSRAPVPRRCSRSSSRSRSVSILRAAIRRHLQGNDTLLLSRGFRLRMRTGHHHRHGDHFGRPQGDHFGRPRRDHLGRPHGDHIGRPRTSVLARPRGARLPRRGAEPALDRGHHVHRHLSLLLRFRAVVLDAFSRRVVGWSVATHLRTEIVLADLEMALPWN